MSAESDALAVNARAVAKLLADIGCHTDCQPDAHTDCYPDPATCHRYSGALPHRHGLPVSDDDPTADTDY